MCRVLRNSAVLGLRDTARNEAGDRRALLVVLLGRSRGPRGAAAPRAAKARRRRVAPHWQRSAGIVHASAPSGTRPPRRAAGLRPPGRSFGDRPGERLAPEPRPPPDATAADEGALRAGTLRPNPRAGADDAGDRRGSAGAVARPERRHVPR